MCKSMRMVAAMLAAGLVSVATASWKAAEGPYGGRVTAFALQGDTLFAGTLGGGIYRSTNAGERWNLTNAASVYGRVTALYSTGNGLFAGVWTGAILRSTDHGLTWERVASGLTDQGISAFAAANGVMYAGTGTDGVFVSTDNGDHWERVTGNLKSRRITALCIRSDGLFVGTSDSGIFRSTDQGSFWTEMNTGISEMSIRCLATAGGNLYAGTVSRIFRSTNNGANWTAMMENMPPAFVSSIFATGDSLFAGAGGNHIYRASASGNSWSRIEADFQMQRAGETYDVGLSALLKEGKALFAGTDRGIYRTTDYGKNWKMVNAGLAAASVAGLATSGKSLFAATFDLGIYRSTDGCATWTSTDSGIASRFLYCIAAANSAIYIGQGIGGTIAYSTDNGALWRTVSPAGFPGFYVDALAISGETIYASTETGVVAVRRTDTLFVADSGYASDWRPTSLAVCGNTVFAGVENTGVAKSTDGGKTWVISRIRSDFTQIYAVAANATARFVGTSAGLWRSTDDGNNWAPVSGPLSALQPVSLAVTDAFQFAGTTEGGIYASVNSGADWTDAAAGLPRCRVAALAITDRLLIAGTDGMGVWYRPLSEMTGTTGRTVLSDVAETGVGDFAVTRMQSGKWSLRYRVEEPGKVYVTLRDLTGRTVAILVNGWTSPGNHTVGWNTSGAGCFLLEVRTDRRITYRKLPVF